MKNLHFEITEELKRKLEIAVIDIAGITSVFSTEIADLKQRIQQQEQKESLCHQLIERMPDGLYRSTRDGRFVEVNQAMVDMLGYATREELMAIDIKNDLYFHPEERESVLLLDQMKELGIYRLRKKDGSELWVEDHGWYITDDEGEIQFHEGILRDFTERKQITDALAKSEEKYRLMFGNSPQPMLIYDIDANSITEVNEAMVKLYGYSEEEILNLPIGSLIYHPQTSDVSSNTFLPEKPGFSNGEWQHVKKNGEIIDVRVTAHTVLAHNKKSRYVLIQDITARKRAEYELRLKNLELKSLNAQKDKFFSIIAHDLKTPFNSIMGFSDLLVEQMKDKDLSRIEKFAEIIQESSRRAMDLLMNLMEWSRSQTGRMEFFPEWFNMSDLIHEVIPLLNDAANSKQIQIEMQLLPQVLVLADKSMISTVLRNMISNAIKFTHPRGTIIVSVVQNPEEVVVAVKDTGIGMSDVTLRNLFRIDSSISTPGTANEKGTGLGLILCKEFIEKHNGKIWASSRLGSGSSFYFSLPHQV
jgi:PAS domain S-box-containing protein